MAHAATAADERSTGAWVSVRVSDPGRTAELRDYFERLGVAAVVNDDTVRAQCFGTYDSRRAREEIEGYVDSWVKINRVPVQLT